MTYDSFAANGFVAVPGVLSAAECESISASVSSASRPSRGTRSLLLQSWCASLANSLRQHSVLSKLVPGDFVAVQCTYFEKSSSNNWLVPIHQDLSIPVAERVEAPELCGWSRKEGTLFVQAPVNLLAQLVALRVHLDDCALADGPLRVVPGSHVLGRIEAEAAISLRTLVKDVPCTAQRGTALALRPLLLHSSSKARGASRRRVLHFLFGPRVLPHALRWQYAV
jgi:hypothetical protein